MESLQIQGKLSFKQVPPLPHGIAAFCPSVELDTIRRSLWKLGVSRYVDSQAPISSMVRHFCESVHKGKIKITPQEFRDHLASVVPHLHADEDYYSATNALLELGDKKAMRSYAHFLMSVDYNFDAMRLFKACDFSPGVFRAARYHNRFYKNEWSSQYSSFADYYRMEAEKEHSLSFRKWIQPFARNKTATFAAAHGPLLIGYSLREQYDLCVPIATKGLRGGFFFELFGVPTLVAETHLRRRFGDRPYTEHRWLSNIDPAQICGKRVIVVDNDIVTGRTLKRVARELVRFNPKILAVAFTDSTADSPRLASGLRNVPEVFTKVHLCTDFDPIKLGEAMKLAHKLRSEADLKSK